MTETNGAAGMHIWVDADACPAVVRDILFRASERWRLRMTLVANQLLRTPPSPWIRAYQVARGFDVADDYIAAQVCPGDLVITADIPLAAQVLKKGALVLDPRGERHSAETIGERLSMRDMMASLRDAGVDMGGPSAFSAADSRAFAASLDSLLARMARGRQG